MFSFIFHSHFNFGSHSTVNKLPKPLHCCRIQRNSKQFVNSFGIDCYIFGIARPTLDDDVYEIEVENIENVDDLTDKIIKECEMEILS